MKNHFTISERKTIEKQYASGLPVGKIAALIGRHRSSIFREIIRGSNGAQLANGRPVYSAELGERVAVSRRHKKRSAADQSE